ncbi:hypothetical protein GDO81_004881 [Engystomops pustulosus]|uniref:PHD-type domain-containing protein n=1 Tax=Engystomops pustulosus TaxID=76066 RepID=A0AAV7CJW6_ENGPU|nr:hypothetical protein GDO81_004881 [Engystomops pustulosus]
MRLADSRLTPPVVCCAYGQPTWWDENRRGVKKLDSEGARRRLASLDLRAESPQPPAQRGVPAMSLPDTCAFCKTSEENYYIGNLQRSPDGRVVAHRNCMLYCPPLISRGSQEETEGFECDIELVLSEIERGKKLRCFFNRCRKRGATVGCDVEECRRTYHFPCVEKAKGSLNQERFIVFCFEHKRNQANDPEKSQDAQPSTSGQCLRPDSGSEESDPSMRPDSGSEESDSSMRPDSGSEESDSSMRPDSGSEESDSSMRPDSGSEESDSSMRPDSGSEESDSLLSPRMIRVFSLSGFPKTKKKYSSNRKPNSQLNEVLGTLSSQDKKVLSQIYSELGGSQQNVDIEMDTDAENENGQMITDDENDSDVTENSTDRTLDGLPDTIPVNALDHSTEENPFPGEQPNNNILDIISKTPKFIDILASRLSMKAQAQFSESNTRDRSCMRTPDTSSCSSNGMYIYETSELSNGVMHSVTPDTENIRGANLLGLSKGIRSPSQLIQSNNTKEKLDSEPKSYTDVHKSIGCSLDLHNVTLVEVLETQGTSEVDPAGSPVTEYEVTSYTPLTQEKEGNREEAYTSVSDWTALSIMDDSPEFHCYNGGTFPVASTSDAKTLLNVNRGENKRNIPNFLSPQQITDISKKLVRGDLCKQFKTIVPKIQSAINSPRGYTATEAEETRDDQAYSERSPNPHTMNQPAENYFHRPLNNQGSSGISC